MASEAPARTGRLSRGRALALLLSLTAAALLAVAWQHRLGGVLELLPGDDPAVRLDAEITATFGMQNPIVWVVAARQGTVWTRPLLTHVQELTHEVFTLPGVVAPDVLSIASPNLRDVDVSGDSMQPRYVMPVVPSSDAEIDALRQRVEANPNYRDVFISRDGRAAMIVADFLPDAGAATGTAALALRDRHQDAGTLVYTSGRPVVAASVSSPALHTGLIALLILAVGVAMIAWHDGVAFVLAAAVATGLSIAWAFAALALVDAIVLPWTAFAFLPAVLLAIVLTAIPAAAWPAAPAISGGWLLGFAVLALIAAPPTRAFGAAMAVSVLVTILAAAAARLVVDAPPRQRAWPRAVSPLAWLLIVAAIPGLIWFRSSFAFVGYARRYLPPPAAQDVHAIAAHFPPPVTLAVRIRGEPGFVESPTVLATLDAIAAAARADPAVTRAMSIADLVKLMHRVFNDNRPELFTIPDERAAVARYLTLGYSPGFRTFIDRAFSETVVWAYLSSEAPEDVARVRARMTEILDAHPLPETTVDVAGGDGALILVAAAMVRRLAWGALAALLTVSVIIAITGGLRLAGRTVAGALLAVAVTAGAMGWTAVPVDLISVPLLIAAGTVGGVLAAFAAASDGSLSGIALALVVMALFAFLPPYPAAHLVGATFLGIALTIVASGRRWTARTS